MIDVLAINRDEFFPSIDLLFRNTGPSTAIIWQFAIDIVNIDVDASPSLSFQYKTGTMKQAESNSIITSDKYLVIEAANYGWGLARGCEFVLVDPLLGTLFPEEQMRFNSNVASGKTEEIFTLTPEDIDPELFDTMHMSMMAEAKKKMEQELPAYLQWNGHMTPANGYPKGYLQQSFEEYKIDKQQEFKSRWYKTGIKTDQQDEFDKQFPVIPLSNPRISWLCTDIRNNMYQGLNDLTGPGKSGELYVGKTFFLYEESASQSGDLATNVKYCCIIDPEQSPKPKKRSYAISKMIPSGSSESFRLMIGATKSCRMQLRFSFSIDGSQDISSDIVEIELSNPINSNWNQKFRDGDQMRKSIMGLANTKPVNSGRKSTKKLLKESRWAEDKLALYPFISTDNR